MARIASTTSSGVPTPGGGMTLAALMARQKQLAQRQEENQQQQATNIPSGLAQMSNALFGGLQQRRADQDLASGRQRFAEIVSGYDPNSSQPPQGIGELMALEPDMAMKLMEGAAQARRDAAAAQAAIANREDIQAFTAQQSAAQIAAAAEQGNLSRASTAEQGNLSRAATAEQGTLTREQQIKLQQEKLAAEAATAAEKPLSDVGQIEADFKANRIDQATRDARIVKANTVTRPLGSASDRSKLWEQQDAYVNTASSANQLRRAAGLLKEGINTGYSAGVRNMAATGLGIGDEATATRTKDYNSIMNQEAISAMSQALKGATTDTEMAEFIKNMNDPTLDPSVKEIQINTMLSKVDAFQRLQAQRITDLDGDVPHVDPVTAPQQLPADVTEEDITATMAKRNMTRQQVLDQFAQRQKAR